MKILFILILIYSNYLLHTNGQWDKLAKLIPKRTGETTVHPATHPTLKSKSNKLASLSPSNANSEDQILKSSADSIPDSNNDDDNKGTTDISSDSSTQTSSGETDEITSPVTSQNSEEKKDTSSTEIGQNNPTDSIADSSTDSAAVSTAEGIAVSTVDSIADSTAESTAESTADVSTTASTRSLKKITQTKSPVKKESKKSFLSSITSGLSLSKLKSAPAVNDQNQEAFLQKYYKALTDRLASKKEVDVNLKAFKGGPENQSEKEQKETDSFFTQFRNYLGKTCFKDIGCFSATEYNDFSNRPIPMLPMSPESIAPVFHVYTIQSRSVPKNYSYNATSDQLKQSTFNPELRTAFIVHGFQSGYALWMENLKDFIFYRSDDKFNVVVVVWEKGSKVPMYNLAATNTRVVGACIGFFIETLCKTYNMKNDMFYLIGHSLGGHTIGYAGKRLLKPKVARIVALDPAGVGFHFTNPAMRLDSSDGTIVTAIHTDGALIFSEGFGTQDTLGHYDFYPNGGTWQPGCPESMSVAQKLGSITSGKDITCSHSRACLVISNLDKDEDRCQAIAYQCPSYEMFLEGRCADCDQNRCEIMGINPDYWLTTKPNNKTINKKYYINTSHKEDYCLQHYQFAFHITTDSDSATGNLHLYLKTTTENQTKEIEIQRIMTKTAHKIHTLLVNFDFPIDKIFALDLSWKRYNPLFERLRINRGFALKIPYIEINYMSNIDPGKREMYSSILCAQNPRIIPNGGKTEYKECKPELKDRGLNTPAEKLEPIEWKEDIYAVDSAKLHKLFHKIPDTRIKETVNKNDTVI